MSAYASAFLVSYVPETGTPPSLRALPGIVYCSSENKLYLYGGRKDVIYGDMWEFDLNSKIWSEIHPGSIMSPGPRYNTHLVMLEKSRQFVLFGGETESGPISDVWLYDIDSEIVKFMQWKLVDTKEKSPPRAYYRAVCDYIHEGNHYIAVYGGLGKSGYVKSLYT
jgi:hypothetical protein